MRLPAPAPNRRRPHRTARPDSASAPFHAVFRPQPVPDEHAIARAHGAQAGASTMPKYDRLPRRDHCPAIPPRGRPVRGDLRPRSRGRRSPRPGWRSGGACRCWRAARRRTSPPPAADQRAGPACGRRRPCRSCDASSGNGRIHPSRFRGACRRARIQVSRSAPIEGPAPRSPGRASSPAGHVRRSWN